MPFTFRDLNLREAEESLIAGCLDHEHALLETARELGLLPFRSEVAEELHVYYGWLFDTYLDGSYDEHENRDRLALALPDEEQRWRVRDDLFDGNTAVAAYCVALVAALRKTYDLQDEEVAATKARIDAPVGAERREPVAVTTMSRFKR